MVKNLNLTGNSTASPAAHPSIYPSIHPSIHSSIWCRNAIVAKRLGAESSRGINKYGAETSRAESSRCRNVCKSPECNCGCRKVSCPSIGTVSANQNQASDYVRHSVMYEKAAFCSPEEYSSVAR